MPGCATSVAAWLPDSITVAPSSCRMLHVSPAIPSFAFHCVRRHGFCIARNTVLRVANITSSSAVRYLCTACVIKIGTSYSILPRQKHLYRNFVPLALQFNMVSTRPCQVPLAPDFAAESTPVPTPVTYIASLPRSSTFSVSVHRWTPPQILPLPFRLDPRTVDSVAWQIKIICDGVAEV